MSWERHEGTLTLGPEEDSREYPAEFWVTAHWDGRRISHWSTCKLAEAPFNGKPRSRAWWLEVLGADELRRQEDIAGENWREANNRLFHAA